MPIPDRVDLAIENTKQAFERRERTSELEKLYISTHYYDIVTGELDKAIEAYQLWKRTYPRDSIPTNNLSVCLRVPWASGTRPWWKPRKRCASRPTRLSATRISGRSTTWD